MADAVISVVMPTFNRSGSERHFGMLKQALATLRHQYCSVPYEILIGTEVPQPGQGRLLRYLHELIEGDKRIRLVVSQANRKTGQGPTNNMLYDLASGRYVTRPQGDDELFDPHYLQRMYDALQNDPDAVLAYADFRDIDSFGRVRCERRRGEHSWERLSRECYIGICVLLDLEWVRITGERWLPILACEDWEYWKRLGKYAQRQGKRFVHVPEILGSWRDWEGNLTTGVRRGEIEPGKVYE